MYPKENSKAKSMELLTNREQVILQYWMKGHTHKAIAQELYISPETVRKHIQNIYKKLRVNNKMQALHKMKLL